MSLASAWDGIQAGCVAVPQQGYSAQEPSARYQLSYAYGVNRSYWRFDYDVLLRFDCPSPPHTFRAYWSEKPPAGSSLDPVLIVQGFLAVCGSPGLALGTSRWFTMATLTLHWAAAAVISPDWVHIMDYGTNEGSIGLVRSGVPFPVA